VWVPIIRIGFQDDAVRTFVREGEAFHQLVWSRAPRACAFDNSPTLLPPPEFAIELTVADMHDGQFGHCPAIRFWEHESNGVRVDDLQPRLWLEVHKISRSEGLLSP